MGYPGVSQRAGGDWSGALFRASSEPDSCTGDYPVQSGNADLTLRLQLGGKHRRKALGHIATTLSQHPTLASAARTLGIAERTLYRWLERYPSLRRAHQDSAHAAAVQEFRSLDMRVIVPVVNESE